MGANRPARSGGVGDIPRHGAQRAAEGDIRGPARREGVPRRRRRRGQREERSHEPGKSVWYNTNFDFYDSPVANWRDTLYINMDPNPPDPAELPKNCR